jgi:hypothetical protein
VDSIAHDVKDGAVLQRRGMSDDQLSRARQPIVLSSKIGVEVGRIVVIGTSVDGDNVSFNTSVR